MMKQRELRKITIMTLGSLGDFIPFYNLACRFKNEGYEVTLGTHLKYRSRVEEAGLKFSPLRLDPEELIKEGMSKMTKPHAHSTVLFISELARILTPYIKTIFEDIEAAADGVDVLLYSALMIGAPDVAQKVGAKAFAAILQLLSPTSEFHSSFSRAMPFGGIFYNKLTYHGAWLMFWLVFKDIVNNIRESRYSLKRVKTLHPYIWHKRMGIPYLYGFSRYIIPKPHDWDSRTFVTGYWFSDENEDYERESELEKFITRGKRPVYIGFGSMGAGNDYYAEKIVKSLLENTEERIILLTGGMNLEIEDERLFSDNYIPHSLVFPNVKCAVHHGGAGTVSSAARYGAYQVILPLFADQYLWSEIISDLGLGIKPFQLKNVKPDKLASIISGIDYEEHKELLDSYSNLLQNEDGAGRVVEIVRRIYDKRHSIY